VTSCQRIYGTAATMKIIYKVCLFMACTEPHLALAVFEEKAGHCL